MADGCHNHTVAYGTAKSTRQTAMDSLQAANNTGEAADSPVAEIVVP